MSGGPWVEDATVAGLRDHPNTPVLKSHDVYSMEHLNGVPWHQAPAPPWWHRCKPQTRAKVGPFGFDVVERCACGAINIKKPGEGDYWLDRNDRRRNERRHGKR